MANKVRAKFRCNCITDYGDQKQASFSAVYAHDSDENADFTKATPWGELKINIASDVPANGFFKPKQDYYLTFEAVPEK